MKEARVKKRGGGERLYRGGGVKVRAGEHQPLTASDLHADCFSAVPHNNTDAAKGIVLPEGKMGG